MDRAQKSEAIEALKGVFEGAGAVVVTHNLGLTVAQMSDLRGRLRKEGAAYKVVKNRLAQKAMNGAACSASLAAAARSTERRGANRPAPVHPACPLAADVAGRNRPGGSRIFEPRGPGRSRRDSPGQFPGLPKYLH